MKRFTSLGLKFLETTNHRRCKMNEKVKTVLNGIVEQFKSGNIPASVAFSQYPAPKNIPLHKWSFLNRTVCFFSGTMDARGFRQWQKVKRNVKKGSKAIYILAPIFFKKEQDGEETMILGGFKSVPVFRLEDTEGEPLDYEVVELPDLPLLELAEEWGISVKNVPGNFRYLGFYSDERKEIGLASKDECIFFHELAHAAHYKLKPDLEPGQKPFKEIIADLSAQALCSLVGKSDGKYLGNTYRYIESYAKKMNKSPITACMQVLDETEQVLRLILKGGVENV